MKTAINLLPLDLRVSAPRFPWRKVGRAFVALVAMSGLAGAAWLAYIWRASYFAELNAVREETARLQTIVAARDELVRVEDVLRKKQAFVDQTKESRPLWQALRTLGEAAPPGVTVSSFTMDSAAVLTIEGIAPGLVAVARFLRAIEASGYYASPQVVFPQPFSAEGGQIKVPYKITAGLGGG